MTALLGATVVVLILDVTLEAWRITDGTRRCRERDRDRAAMLRTLDRTGGPRP
jgi:hypothetical protein